MTRYKVLYFGWSLDDMTGVSSNGTVARFCVMIQGK